MVSDKFKLLLQELRDNVFVDKKSLAKIERKYTAGEITEQEALRQLQSLDPEHSANPLFISSDQVEDEWTSLAGVIVEAEKTAKKRASSQFFIGLTALPIYIVVVVISLPIFKWYNLENSATIVAVLAVCLAAISAHSFFVLRIHQQASIAAERLSEKRLGILFLRIAASREHSAESAKLLEAGTAMFLGHHAPATIPLQSEDYAATNKKQK